MTENKSKWEKYLEQRFNKLKTKVEGGHYSICQFIVVLIPNYDKKPDRKGRIPEDLKISGLQIGNDFVMDDLRTKSLYNQKIRIVERIYGIPKWATKKQIKLYKLSNTKSTSKKTQKTKLTEKEKALRYIRYLKEKRNF